MTNPPADGLHHRGAVRGRGDRVSGGQALVVELAHLLADDSGDLGD